MIYLWLPSVEIAIERVRTRVQSGGHDVPEEIVRRRFSKSLRNFFEVYAPACTSWRLYDGGAGPDRRLVAFGAGSGTIEVRQPKLWEQIEEQARKR